MGYFLKAFILYLLFVFMLIIGIDDAGRGPVIGPMVLAGVLIDKSVEKDLIKLGIKDSKMLSPKKREQLAREIEERAIATHRVVISVDEIDNQKTDGLNLNQREAIAAAMIINKLNDGKENINVVIDCPSVNLEAWKDEVDKYLVAKANIHLVCEHKADANHIIVGAASILAKVRRDCEVKKIRERIGVDFGSGYPSDPVTRKFIYEHYKEFEGKGIFRESWSTIKKHKAHGIQKKLF